MPTCPSCGRENPADFTFCPACGASLTGPAAPVREVRKTVTVVFCDVTGSTAIGERLDPESLRRVMTRYFSEMRTALERHGGTVEKFIGDAVMAVFGVPRVHEDDALRAVRAAADMREAVRLLTKEVERDQGVALQTRIGVNTGEVVAGDGTGGSLVTGDAVNVAARLEQAASPGEILIGAETHGLVRDAVVAEPVDALELKGKSEAVAAFRLIEVAVGVEGIARRLDSPMIGRDRQLGQLRQAFDAAVDDRACQLFTVLGTPGVGKSRLIHEFLAAVEGEATVLRGRCLPYGDGITFFPVAEVVKEAAGLEDFDAPAEIERKICAVLGEAEEGSVCSTLAQLFAAADRTGSAEETLWAVRRFLESVAQEAPLVVVFDDIHWGESTFLDLIEHVTDWSRDAPILVLCMARPELLDVRPAWGGGKMNAATISLEGLSDEDCGSLVANLLGSASLPDEARRRILGAAEGTPLFVEQMLSMLIDDGLLVRDEAGWSATADLTEIPVPPSVQALIAARLDRLGPDERAAIERAAVAGKEFSTGAVTALSDDPAGVRSALMALVRRDLILPDRSSTLGGEGFRFRHLLVRDAAYDAIPKATRAALHERFADWLQGVAGDRIEEQEEILGYHLEQASRSRAELGPPDDATIALGVRAATHLSATARRASDRGDLVAAGRLHLRAAMVLPEGHADRPTALYEAGLQLGRVGEPVPGLELTEEAERAATSRGDEALRWRARLAINDLRTMVDPHAITVEGIRRDLESAIATFERLGDEEGIATAWVRMAESEWLPCRFDDARAELDHAIEHAHRSGNQGLLHYATAMSLATDVFGSTTPADGLVRLEATVPTMGEAVFIVEHLALVHRGVFLAMVGDLEAGRRLLAEAEALARRKGATFWLSAGLQLCAYVEEFGDHQRALRAAREAYETLAAAGDEGHASTDAGNLARALCRVGRFDEAETYAAIATATTQEDVTSQVTGLSAQALIRSAAGEHDEAMALGRAAVGRLTETQSPDFDGVAWLDLAKVLRAAGREDDALDAARQALALHERKGNLPAVDAVRTFLDSTG